MKRSNKGQFIKGHIPWNTGKKHTIETRQKISMVQKGKKRINQNTIHLKPYQFKKGHKHSKETKLKISQCQMGRLHSDKTKRKMKERYLNGKKVHSNAGYGKQGIRNDIGHYVRSTWEANIARILKFNNIKYEYEPKRFDLGEIGTYLPDFYLPEKNLYIEVKGYWRRNDKEKYNKFKENHNILLIEKNEYKHLKHIYNHFIPNWEGK